MGFDDDPAEVVYNLLMRIIIVLYIICGHAIKLMLWPTGLKIAYINHKPWPWRKLWHGFVHVDTV